MLQMVVLYALTRFFCNTACHYQIYYTMRIKECLRIALLYIGLAVGAGFATGKEISLYFQGASIPTIIISGVSTALFCYIFLTVGRLRLVSNKRISTCLKVIYAIGGFTLSSLMLSCLRDVFNLEGLGIILLCSMLCMTLSLNSSKGVKLFTSASVPVIIVCCILVAVKCKYGVSGGELKVANGIKYSAMNMFFQCAYISREGEGISRKEGFVTSLIVGVISITLLLPMYSIARLGSSSLPFLERASEQGMGFIAIVELLFAILTTITSGYSLCLDVIAYERPLVVFVIIAFSVILSLADFSTAVGVVYPLLSYAGIILLSTALVGIAVYIFRNHLLKKRKKPKEVVI